MHNINKNMAFQKGYLKKPNEDLMQSEIDYDLLALGLGRGCNFELSSNPNVIHLLEKNWIEFVGIILSENMCI